MQMPKPRMGTCLCCGKQNAILVSHHWFKDDSYTIGYIRSICVDCNLILRSEESNHILPSWAKQIQIVRKYRDSKVDYKTENEIVNLGLEDLIKLHPEYSGKHKKGLVYLMKHPKTATPYSTKNVSRLKLTEAKQLMDVLNTYLDN